MRGNPLKDGRPHAAEGVATFRPTPADTLLLRALAYKASYFARKGMLAADGSFFYSDKRLAFENGLAKKTVTRVKKRLKRAGKIEFKPGKFRGQATRYWVISIKEVFWIPFIEKKGGQKASAYKVNRFKKIASVPKEKMTEEQERERHNAFQECIKGLRRKHGSVT